jgi:hypothetical protein
VPDLAAEVERWKLYGHVATFHDPSMAIIQLKGGIRIALLGKESGHPSHLALGEPDLERFHEIALLAGVEPTIKKDGSRSFYAKGGAGVAIEWMWRPENMT